MITRLFPCCLLLLTSSWTTIVSTPQSRIPPSSVAVESPGRRVGQAEVAYSAAGDKTNVDVPHLTIWGKDENRIDLHMSYSTKGRRVRLPELVEIDISSIAERKRFKADSKVEFMVDGRRWPPISVEPQVEVQPKSVLEDYVFFLSVEQFRRIGKARNVDVKIGPIEVKLSATHREAFLDMLRAAE